MLAAATDAAPATDAAMSEASTLGPRLIVIASGAYIGVMMTTLVQALQGHPLLAAGGAGAAHGGNGWAVAVGAICVAAFALLAWLQKAGAPDPDRSLGSSDLISDPRVTVATSPQA
jgi:hypothetical protein